MGCDLARLGQAVRPRYPPYKVFLLLPWSPEA